MGRECFGYAKAPWGVCSEGLPVRVVRRRATLPHPVGCSTIAVPGLSFRVRNGTGRLTWAMAAANLLLYGQTLGSAGLWRPGNRTADADMSMFRLVARQCSLPSGAVCRRKMRSNRQGLECWCCLSSVSTGRLHPSRGFHVRPINHVFCMGTAGSEDPWNPYLGAGFPLRCFQRLSLPNVANQPRHWRDNRHTRGSSTQVLSYYGQASSAFQRAQRIETKLSHDVLNPARVPL